MWFVEKLGPLPSQVKAAGKAGGAAKPAPAAKSAPAPAARSAPAPKEEPKKKKGWF
jgi:hypothetical protein